MKPRWKFVLLIGLGIQGVVSLEAYGASLSQVARRLAKGLEKQPSRRIAVLPFAYSNGTLSSGSSLVSERLTTLLVENGGVEVVERALLDKAIGEIRLGMTGLLDPATTQKLGKVIGVQAIVTGTLADLDEHTSEVNARLIQTETGSILAAAAAHVRRSWSDIPKPPPSTSSGGGQGEEPSKVHMSKLISHSSPRRRPVPPVYAGVVQADPSFVNAGAVDDVLTLNEDDLIPLRYQNRTDPEGIVERFLSESGPASENQLRMARRIYHRDADTRLRARALMAMGHLLERSNRPGQAERAYRQILAEFPDTPGVTEDARRRLNGR